MNPLSPTPPPQFLSSPLAPQFPCRGNPLWLPGGERGLGCAPSPRTGRAGTGACPYTGAIW